MKVDDRAEKQQINNVKKWKSQRNNKKTQECLSKLKKVASAGENIMEISVECAHQGVTTGEWSNVMREVFGEYRAPTGIVSSHISNSNFDESDIEQNQKK